VSLGAAILPNGFPDPGMPIPDAVQVVEALHQPSSFTLHYQFASADGDFPLLSDSHLEPEKEIAVMVMVDMLPKFLVQGPITRQEIAIENGGSSSTLAVSGGDKSVAMDREDKAKVWNNVTDSLAVAAVLADYSIVPDVSVTSTVHTEFTRSLVQRETDLRFVRRLARRNGFWFWVTTEAPGVSIGHFRRVSPGSPDADLAINAAVSTVDRVSIEVDTERPVAATMKQVKVSDKSVMDGSVDASPLTGLANSALGDIVKAKRSAHLAVAADDVGDLKSRAEAMLIDHGWFVTAHVVARLSVLKQLVRAHTVVSLNGLGKRHSGSYIVSRVVHDITPADHVMSIDLVRNGWN
jgi:phage protein D